MLCVSGGVWGGGGHIDLTESHTVTSTYSPISIAKKNTYGRSKPFKFQRQYKSYNSRSKTVVLRRLDRARLLFNTFNKHTSLLK